MVLTMAQVARTHSCSIASAGASSRSSADGTAIDLRNSRREVRLLFVSLLKFSFFFFTFSFFISRDSNRILYTNLSKKSLPTSDMIDVQQKWKQKEVEKKFDLSLISRIFHRIASFGVGKKKEVKRNKKKEGLRNSRLKNARAVQLQKNKKNEETSENYTKKKKLFSWLYLRKRRLR